MSFSVVILAAGKGTRMKSSMPKVLHPIGAKPMVQRIIDTVNQLGANSINLVYGHQAEQLQSALGHNALNWCLQAEQLGTGHAVQQTVPYINDNEDVLILVGDAPLIKANTLHNLLQTKAQADVALLTVNVADPTGMGRIIRQGDQVTAIVEHKDASDAQRQINEINTGMMVLNGKDLKRWLANLNSNNAQGEFYLTDVIEMAANEGKIIKAAQPTSEVEVEGINNRKQLAAIERAFQFEQAEELMMQGVSLLDPHRQAVVGENCSVGPYARLRPGTVMHENARVGNFVEMKKTTLGKGSKANHLSYLGDTTVGIGANIGAGTITCNYDGVNKSKTIIGDGAFIGSNSALVAPVQIGNQATVGAGSVITKTVADEELAIARAKQRNISGWQRPTKP